MKKTLSHPWVHFEQIADGPFAGCFCHKPFVATTNVAALFGLPSPGHDRAEQQRFREMAVEQKAISDLGGSLIVFDPKADPVLIQKIMALSKTRKNDLLLVNFQET
jgi:hypothetical protein